LKPQRPSNSGSFCGTAPSEKFHSWCNWTPRIGSRRPTLPRTWSANLLPGKALQENTGNVLVKTQLATLYFDSKRYEEAAQLYREINEVGKTKAVLERLLTIYQIQKRSMTP